MCNVFVACSAGAIFLRFQASGDKLEVSAEHESRAKGLDARRKTGCLVSRSYCSFGVAGCSVRVCPKSSCKETKSGSKEDN